ncbi:MAG: hypothetical protein JWP91_4743 [Fibrobacteres bacterium]|nr:hypothetical protein [Fibrobacterota bacterium]
MRIPEPKHRGLLSAAVRIPLVAAAFAFAFPILAQTPEFSIVKETGPRNKRVNMVILGDGYTAAEKSRFLMHLKTIADGVIKDEPFRDYEGYFNVYAIFVPSNQSGADVPAEGVYRDTYFGASYDGRLLTINDSKAMTLINKYLPEADMQFTVVNSDRYGGSGGQVAVACYANPEIIAHEAQHSFAGLGDEYDYAGVEPWEAPNTTQRTSRSSIPWSHWIAAATPVPTPETQIYANLPGLFEGAAYNPKGWYRPKQNCRMRENGIPFCEACSETVLLSLYSQISPIDSALPKPGPVTVAANQIAPLRIKVKQPLSHGLEIRWTVDGNPSTSITGPQFTQALAPGPHRVSVKVADTTHMVRKDPDGLLNDSAAWQVNVMSVTGIASSPPEAPPWLLEADADQAVFLTDADQEFEVRMMTADGRILESRSMRGSRSGRIRMPWARTLAPGLYVVETRFDGRVARSRFSISP